MVGSVTLSVQFSCITLIHQHKKKSCLSLVGLSITLFVFKAVCRQGWKHQQPEQPGIIGVEGFNSQHFSWRFASSISKCWHEFLKWDNLLPFLGQMSEQQHNYGICFQRQNFPLSAQQFYLHVYQLSSPCWSKSVRLDPEFEGEHFWVWIPVGIWFHFLSKAAIVYWKIGKILDDGEDVQV